MTSTREVSVPVEVGGQPAVIRGTLCVPEGARTVQLLVHGYTYDRRYWDFPYQPERYSYVRRATEAGYATLAIDRVGTGASSRPASRHLTWATSAATVQRVVAALRSGVLEDRFDRVVLVGHSYGSVTSYRVADRFGGVDALVVTGLAHRMNLPAFTRRVVLESRRVPPSSPLRPSGPFSVSLRHGQRRHSFGATNPDEDLLALDEQLRQPAGFLELPTAVVYLATPVSRATAIPSLTVLGDRDPLFTGRGAADVSSDGALAAFERRFYAPGATVEAAVIRGAGHCLALEPGADEAARRILEFCDRHVGR